MTPGGDDGYVFLVAATGRGYSTSLSSTEVRAGKGIFNVPLLDGG
jgi:hypothetical protein